MSRPNMGRDRPYGCGYLTYAACKLHFHKKEVLRLGDITILVAAVRKDRAKMKRVRGRKMRCQRAMSPSWRMLELCRTHVGPCFWFRMLTAAVLATLLVT